MNTKNAVSGVPLDILELPQPPFIKGAETTRSVMLDVIIALAPALLYGIYTFGARVLSHAVVCVAACVFFEYASRAAMKRDNTTGDLSAVVTGMLLTMCLPVSVPLWMPVMGAFFAVVVVKQLFGGIGKNIVNPALAARIFLAISWPEAMSLFTAPGAALDNLEIKASGADVVAQATPLVYMKAGEPMPYSIFDLFTGNISGSMGEVCTLLLLAGGGYLLLRRVISWHIPAAFLGTAAMIALLFPGGGDSFEYVMMNLLSGGMVLAAFFMATDYTTSPSTTAGKLIFGAGCGFMTMFIRAFGAMTEGAAFAVLIMNLLTLHIEKLTMPKSFGGVRMGRAHIPRGGEKS